MNTSPKVTVLMPVYNVALYVTEAINSILNQTFKDFELLIINDGSTDSTREEVLKFSDSRIRFVENEKNIGLANTLNRGVELANGEYIARMDGDDISMPNRLYEQVVFLECHSEIDICGAGYRFFGAKNYDVIYPKSHDGIKVGLLFGCCMIIPMFRKKNVQKLGLKYNQDYFPAEDYRFWTECMLSGLKMHNLQKILFLYRMHPSQVSEVMTNQKDMTITVKMEYVNQLFLKNDDFIQTFVYPISIETESQLNDLRRSIDAQIKSNLEHLIFNPKKFSEYLISIYKTTVALYIQNVLVEKNYNVKLLFKLLSNGMFFYLPSRYRNRLILKMLICKRKEFNASI